MNKKLKKGIEYKYKIPSYSPFKIGEVVRICNVNNIKKYEKMKPPYMNKLGVIIGYSTKSTTGPMTYAVRVIETGEEYLLYNYLLVKTGSRQFVPKFDLNDEVVNISKKIEGKWMIIKEVLPDQQYKVLSLSDNQEKTVPEKSLRYPTQEDLIHKDVEQRLPELLGVF